jgi:hypothetical protein
MEQQPLGDQLGLWNDPPMGDQPTRDDVRNRGPRLAGSLGRSLPGALAGSLLVTALAFGAATRLTASSTGADGTPSKAVDAGAGAADGASGGGQDGELGSRPGATDGGHATDLGTDAGSATDGEPAATPAGDGPDATSAPTDPVTPTEPTAIAIELHLGSGKVTIDWGACPLDGFVAWKVVRSTDATPAWPLGSGDVLVAGSENPSLRSVLNGDLVAGKTYAYRVFALVQGDGEAAVGCRSRIADIHVPAPEPTPAPTTEPAPIASIGLTATLVEGKPHLDWTTCSGDWDYAKVIRSTNSTVTFPKGEGDSLAGMTGRDGASALTDTAAPAGTKLWYRVFCVRAGGDTFVVVAVSPTRAVTTPAAEPKPEPSPVALSLTTALTDSGVALHWGTCSSDVFVAYKVVRSAGPNPSYLPGTDGSVVISVKESASVTSFTDPNVGSGQTWHYRVQCIGWMNDHQILLGETDVATVTLP